jgi:hypothetical protein
VFVDYTVVSKYFYLLENEYFLNRKDLTTYIAQMFHRIINEVNSVWIFFQIDYLTIINKLLLNTSFTRNALYNRLSRILKDIVFQFTELAKKNGLLMTEILFRIPNRLVRDDILNNYEGLTFVIQ